jgi:hypothetical protein
MAEAGFMIASAEGASPPVHQSPAVEDLKVPGNVGLPGIQVLLELSDRTLSLPESVEDQEPSGLAQNPEPLGHQLNRVRRQHRTTHRTAQRFLP